MAQHHRRGLGVANVARGRRSVAHGDGPVESGSRRADRTAGGLETRMAGVVVAALKTFGIATPAGSSSSAGQLDAERQRAERALRLELLRQAADREIGRLRIVTGVAVAGLIGTLLLAMVPGGIGRGGSARGRGGRRLALARRGAGAGVRRAGAGRRALETLAAAHDERSAPPVSAGGAVAPWMIVGGLALVGMAVLVA